MGDRQEAAIARCSRGHAVPTFDQRLPDGTTVNEPIFLGDDTVWCFCGWREVELGSGSTTPPPNGDQS